MLPPPLPPSLPLPLLLPARLARLGLGLRATLDLLLEYCWSTGASDRSADLERICVSMRRGESCAGCPRGVGPLARQQSDLGEQLRTRELQSLSQLVHS